MKSKWDGWGYSPKEVISLFRREVKTWENDHQRQLTHLQSCWWDIEEGWKRKGLWGAAMESPVDAISQALFDASIGGWWIDGVMTDGWSVTISFSRCLHAPEPTNITPGVVKAFVDFARRRA